MKKTILLLAIFASAFATFAQQKTDFTLEDIFTKGTFRTKFGPDFNVMNDGERYTVLLKDGSADWKICSVKMEWGTDTNIIFSSKDISTKFFPESYEFSADEKFILVTNETERIYRHSSRALSYVIDIAARKIIPVSKEKVMYATISPDNKNVAYVKDNNLYIINIATATETAITTDGKRNSIINGAVDWVYEEEFSMSKGFEWNSNGNYLAFYKFDESGVKEFSMSMYGGLYPTQETWKYPKAGEANSKVDVLIYNITTAKTITCNTSSENDQYLPRIKWTQSPEVLSIQRLNRLQNVWELFFHTAVREKGELILSEENKAYVDITDNLYFISGTKKFLYTSEKSGFRHIYCYDYGKQKETQITGGNFDVIEIKGVNEKEELVYYTSAEAGPTEDHFYVIKFNGKNKRDLTPDEGNHVVTLGKGNKYFTDMHSTIKSPYIFKLKKTTELWSRLLVSNGDLEDEMEKYHFGSSNFGSLTTASGTNLNYWIMKPWNFDSTKKYPVLMYVYGGPGHNTVRNSWGGRNYFWHQYLTQKGYIVVSIDNRGTGNRGEAFKKSTYLQLGKLELQDQTEAAQWLGKKNYVDASRIGIWGWSFGGYMSSLCITKSSDVFKTAIAVAPVTSWRYYDNIYTERFLRTPQTNAEGYDDNSPINFVKNIKGNYLLIHGTGDDNVHFQNAVQMVNAMIAAGVKFDSEYYPNRNHGIGDRAASYHLFQRMTDYVMEKL